jgi:hypothetical protein
MRFAGWFIVAGVFLPSHLALPESSQQAQMSVHRNQPLPASNAEVPISLKDAKTGMIFYVESNGRRLVAFNRAGRVQWSVDVLDAIHMTATVGRPVIRHLRLGDGHLWVTFGKSDTAEVEIETGKVRYIGSD